MIKFFMFAHMRARTHILQTSRRLKYNFFTNIPKIIDNVSAVDMNTGFLHHHHTLKYLPTIYVQYINAVSCVTGK